MDKSSCDLREGIFKSIHEELIRLRHPSNDEGQQRRQQQEGARQDPVKSECLAASFPNRYIAGVNRNFNKTSVHKLVADL